MLFAQEILPARIQIGMLIVMLPTLLIAVRYAGWRLLVSTPARQHLLFGGMLAVLLLWLMQVQVVEGIWIHLLGLSVLTLLVGWCYSILVGTLVAVAYVSINGQPLLVLPACWLFSVLVPATVTRVTLIAVRRTRVQNLFLFTLGAGFGGAALSVLVIAVSVLLVLWLGGRGDLASEALAHTPFLLLVMFPEAFINGLVISALTVFYPDLVKTFDEDFYLDGRS